MGASNYSDTMFKIESTHIVNKSNLHTVVTQCSSDTVVKNTAQCNNTG